MFRTLPLRVALADSESLHSWLLRLAHRNGIPLLRLAPVLGFGDRLRVPHNYVLSWRLPPELLRRIETQTGLSPGALDAAVLDRFEPLGWKPIPGSRYCTRCLAESGGVSETQQETVDRNGSTSEGAAAVSKPICRTDTGSRWPRSAAPPRRPDRMRITPRCLGLDDRGTAKPRPHTVVYLCSALRQ